MNKNIKNTFKLGLFVSIGLLLLVVGVYLVGVRQHLFSSTFRLSGIFSNINGLQVGSNVRCCGINVGIVESIVQITDSTVQVDMQIEEGTRKFIKQNANAAIGSDGLVGDKIVAITAGTAGVAVVSDGAFIATVPQVDMDAILENMKITSDNAVRITGELAFIMENVGDGNGIIGKLFFDSSFAEVMEGAMVNLKEGAGGFKENMDAASNSILLRGYLKKKEKQKAALKAEKEKDAAKAMEIEQSKALKAERLPKKKPVK